MGQVQIERQVISPWVSLGSGTYYVDQTVGQPADITLQSDAHFLTQGFHQPLTSNLEITYALEPPLCDDGSGASFEILSLAGCSESITEVQWNGEIVDLPIVDIEPGVYELVVIADFGCVFSTEIEVDEFESGPCALIFYNAITPDDDNINDTWHIEHLEQTGYTANEVKVFNRWGSLVWSGSNYDNNLVIWTGQSDDNKELPNGTYYWTFESGEFLQKGFVELLR